MRARPHRTLTPLALAVLRLLHERAMHPYEMHQLVRDRGTDLVVKVRAGSLYHTVERLHRLGLIEQIETGREGRRPERTVYAITEAGRDEFMTNLRDLLRFPVEEFPVFAAALEMLATVEPPVARRLLAQRALALDGELARIEQVTSTLVKDGLDRINLIEHEYVRHICQAELTFVRTLIDEIDSGGLTWPSGSCWPPGPSTVSASLRTHAPTGTHPTATKELQP
ncbi:MAG TPA: PadR family transcriptional regulator [Micromonosporaceae bacterium]|nr:PadR family transcriptional regulator [Micromonosporaceae bacterium]